MSDDQANGIFRTVMSENNDMKFALIMICKEIATSKAEPADVLQQVYQMAHDAWKASVPK